MKKIVGAMAVSLCLVAAGNAIAGSNAKKKECPEECMKHIDALQSSQARQDEQLNDHANQLKNHAEQLAAQARELEELRNRKENNPWYVQAALKGTWLGDLDIVGVDSKAEAENGFGGALAFGRQFGDFRVEGEYAGQSSDLEDYADADVKIDTFMVNGSYDVPVGPVDIYATVGMGVGKVDVSVGRVNDSDNTFAYKAGFGVGYGINKNLAVSLGYEYLATNDVIVGSVEVEDIKSCNLVTAVRYVF